MELQKIWRTKLYVLAWLFAMLRSAPVQAQAPAFEWATAYARGGLNEGYASGSATAVDASGNLYITGVLAGTQRFGTTELTVRDQSGIGQDVFVAKLDSTGRVLWAVRGGGVSDDVGTGIALDARGNVYITGYYIGSSATFGTINIRNSGTGITSDLFVAKLDSDGSWLWAVGAGGAGKAQARAIAVNEAGIIYITGGMGLGSAQPGEVAAFGPFTTVNAGGYDIFVAQLSPTGTWQWVTTAGGGLYDNATAIAVDATGNAYLTGSIQSPQVTYGPSTLICQPAYQGTASDLFVAKISPAGAWLWAVAGGGDGWDNGTGIAVDKRDNIYLTGVFGGNASPANAAFFGSTRLTSAGAGDVLTARLTRNGVWRWAVAAGSSTEDASACIQVDETGRGYVCGAYGHVFGLSARFGNATLANTGYTDAFIAQFDSTGSYHWATSINSPGYDLCQSMALARGSLYLTGSIEGPVGRFGSLSVTANVKTFGWIKTGYAARIARVGEAHNTGPGSGPTDSPYGLPKGSQLPNIITPNGDKVNDVFLLKGFPPGPWSLAVYSRWGTQVYEDSNYQNTWGPTVPEGVYYFLIRHAASGQTFKGWVEVVR
ncbi:hypothetical protein GCM10023185_22610 [Hymenobacter saemangeumensis]|uniref:Gliding motility-associated C-terminal domain-containing protein n=1 Tax=Hymenobacter saemangeumensis TaxID=1084522 RepID=A0ABP8IFD1_9BACT